MTSGKYKDVTYTPITWHDLRHAFGTFLAQSGIPGTTREKWCGWADKRTMAIYDHYAPGGFELDQLNQAINRDRERNAQDRPLTVETIS
jgi:integrase